MNPELVKKVAETLKQSIQTYGWQHPATAEAITRAVMESDEVRGLMDKADRLETALRRAEAKFAAIRANANIAAIWAMASSEEREIKAALENKP